LIVLIRSIVAYAFAVFSLCGCTGEFPTDAPKIQAAEQAYDSELLIKSLNEIEAWHLENDTRVASVLGAGRSPSSIDAQFEGTDCRPTEELKSLWSWRDGGIGAVPFVWYHDFLPLQEALSEYKWLLLNPLVQWDPRYIPIFSYEGEWYAAYCGKGASTAGPIIHFFLEDEPRVTHTNLTVFLAGMAEALRSGAVWWENDAMVDDIRKVHFIHQKYNRGYSFPYFVPDGT
jgi:hypothetical protein